MKNTTWYTAFVKFEAHGCVEEIDVEAASESDAYNRVQVQLSADYEPGGQIIKVVPSNTVPGWVEVVQGW